MHETGVGAFIKICDYCIKMARPNSKKHNKKTHRKKTQKGGYAMPSRSRLRRLDSDGVHSRSSSRSRSSSASRRNKVHKP